MVVGDEGASPPGARERRRRRTTRDLARAAVALFEEKGFEATTVEEIAEAADYSARTFFRIFARKEDCVFFDLEARLDAASVKVADATIAAEWSVLRAALLDHARSWEGGDPEFARARARLFHREPALTARYLAHSLRWEEDLVQRILQRGGDRQDRAAVYLAASVVVAAYRTAFRVQVEEGGALVDLLDDALARVEQSGFIASQFRE